MLEERRNPDVYTHVRSTNQGARSVEHSRSFSAWRGFSCCRPEPAHRPNPLGEAVQAIGILAPSKAGMPYGTPVRTTLTATTTPKSPADQ
jgi:hypothetical protein